MKEFRLNVIEQKWPSWLVLLFVFLIFVICLTVVIAIPILFSIKFHLPKGISALLVISFFVGYILYISRLLKKNELWKFTNDLVSLTFQINEDSLMVLEKNITIEWKDVQWYLKEKSKIIETITLSKNDGSILFIRATSLYQTEEWNEFVNTLFLSLDEKALNARAWSDTAFWRSMLWILPLSCILIPLGLHLFGFDWTKVLAGLIAWIGIVILTMMRILISRDQFRQKLSGR